MEQRTQLWIRGNGDAKGCDVYMNGSTIFVMS